jgi:hypothetical protein
MKLTFLSSLACTAALLVAGPVSAHAAYEVNFNETGKQILGEQPGLVEYVEARFDVKETGIAKEPAGDDHPPMPPYIFRARAKGSDGPYNLRLLIQPGLPGHILGILKDSSTSVTKAPATQSVPPTNQPSSPAPQIPSLTADTPSGPISNAPSSNLPPPADPAPTPH